MTFNDLLESYGLVLEQRGLEYWCSCPFHAESNPSFSVTGELFYCFSCKRGGGPIQFISAIERCGTVEAKRRWDTLNGNALVDPEQEEQAEWLASLTVYLEDNKRCRDFFASKGVEKWDTLLHFGIGYDPDTDNLVYPFFEADLPVKWHTRGVDEKEYRSAAPRLLWGLDKLGREDDTVHVVEGYHDVMHLHELGTRAVAMCGSVMHREYWQQLYERNVQTVVIMPDGDRAGKELAKAVAIDQPDFCRVKVAPIAGDPKELSSVPEPKDIFTWYIREEQQRITDPVDLARHVAPSFARLPRWKKDAFREEIAILLGSDAFEHIYLHVVPDFHSEAVVLTNCLYSEQIRNETVQAVGEEHFHARKHQEFFSFVRDNQHPNETLALKHGIRPTVTSDILNYRQYIDSIRSVRQQEVLAETLEKARSRVGSEDPGELIGSVTEDMYAITDEAKVLDSADVVRKVTASINSRVNNPAVLGIPLSDRFPVLNHSLMGFVPNKLVLVSGSTGHGKTNVACNFIDDLIFGKNQAVLFCSLEMTPEEIVERQLVLRTGLAGQKLMTGSLEQSEYDEVLRVSRDFLDKKLYISYGVYSLHRLIGIIRSQVLRHKVRVVFVDYIQLISVSSRKDRWEQLMDITKALKVQVCSMGVTVVALSQLRRSALNSDVPEAADQAGSYGMLADADVAITIKRRAPEDGSNFLIFVDKHRYGVDQVLIDAIFDRGTLQIREVA